MLTYLFLPRSFPLLNKMKFTTVLAVATMLATTTLAVPAPAPAADPVPVSVEERSPDALAALGAMMEKRQNCGTCHKGRYCCGEYGFEECYKC